ncbi:MAG: type III-A CRISPR-associated RAMP protein Csm4 [Halanaerobiales bacterium]
MDKVLKFYLDDKIKFHIGDNKGGLKEIFSSDQFYSAIINKLAILYPENIEELIEKFNDNNKLSSMLYGLSFENKKYNDKDIYFMPKPYAPIITDKDDIQARKLLKKIKYISVDALKEILDNWDEDNQIFNIKDLNFETISNKFLVLSKEISEIEINISRLRNLKFIKQNDRPRISIDRYTSKSENFFYQKNIEFQHQRVNDYVIKPFMFSILSGDIDERFLAAIRLLADEGIGGKRSSGLGIFKSFEIHDIDMLNLSSKNKGRFYLSLSTVYPAKNETKNLLNYDLEKKSGYIYSNGGVPMRKQTIRTIKEGAIFQDNIDGMVIDISPDAFQKHSVFLFGKSLALAFGGDK